MTDLYQPLFRRETGLVIEGIIIQDMDGTDSGYCEIEHTADWMLEVWAPDLPGLLEQSARGMYALSGVRLEAGPRRTVVLEFDFMDAESLLVRFLGELLYYAEQESMGFDILHIQVEGSHMAAQAEGRPVSGRDKEIKAVTYHNLKVQKTERGLSAQIVFDV